MSQENLCDLWDSTKLTNIKLIEFPGEKKKKNGRERMRREEMITENFLNQRRDLNIQVQEVIRSPYYFNVKRPSPRHIIMKLSKIEDKERTLKQPRGKGDNLQRIPV